jgi:hypothetical protein
MRLEFSRPRFGTLTGKRKSFVGRGGPETSECIAGALRPRPHVLRHRPVQAVQVGLGLLVRRGRRRHQALQR